MQGVKLYFGLWLCVLTIFLQIKTPARYTSEEKFTNMLTWINVILRLCIFAVEISGFDTKNLCGNKSAELMANATKLSGNVCDRNELSQFPCKCKLSCIFEPMRVEENKTHNLSDCLDFLGLEKSQVKMVNYGAPYFKNMTVFALSAGSINVFVVFSFLFWFNCGNYKEIRRHRTKRLSGWELQYYQLKELSLKARRNFFTKCYPKYRNSLTTYLYLLE